jgi:hypothetical protein
MGIKYKPIPPPIHETHNTILTNFLVLIMSEDLTALRNAFERYKIAAMILLEEMQISHNYPRFPFDPFFCSTMAKFKHNNQLILTKLEKLTHSINMGNHKARWLDMSLRLKMSAAGVIQPPQEHNVAAPGAATEHNTAASHEGSDQQEAPCADATERHGLAASRVMVNVDLNMAPEETAPNIDPNFP